MSPDDPDQQPPARDVWMRSIRWHTYRGKPQPEGAIYMVYEEEADNIVTLKFAVREAPPLKARR